MKRSDGAGKRQLARKTKVDDEKTATSAERGSLMVNCIPWCRIYLNGKDTGKNSPLMSWPLSPGKYRLRVVNPPTAKSEERDIVIKPGETTRSVVRF